MTGVTTEDLDPLSLRVAGAASLVVIPGVEMKGSFDVKISQEGLSAQVDMRLGLGELGYVEVGGALEILNTNEGPVFAMKAYLDADLSIAIISIKASAVLEINTSKTTEYAGVAAGTTFNLALDGKLSVLAFDLSFAGSISVTEGLFKIEITKAEVNFFNVIKINVTGYVSSDGHFLINGEASFKVKAGPISLEAGVSLTIGHDRIGASVYGALKLKLDMGFFNIDATLAGFSGDIMITTTYASLKLKATLAGISISTSMNWSFQDPPKIASQVGTTLYLHTGEMASQRGTFTKVDNESYVITQSATGKITIESLGQTKSFTGVDKIVATGGDGDNVFFIGENVTADLYINGGKGDDTFIVAGGSANSVLDGGEGNDEFQSGIADRHYYGGTGNDNFVGSDFAEYVHMGVGSNTINAAGGDDKIYIEGDDVVDAGAGDDVVYANLYTSLNVTFGSGRDRLSLESFVSDEAIILGAQTLSYKDAIIKFDDTLSILEITDTSNETIIINDETTTGWLTTGLDLKASGVIDVTNAKFIMQDASLILQTDGGVKGTIQTQVDEITIINNTLEETYADIVINEVDAISVVDANKQNGGLVTQKGKVDVTVNNGAQFNFISGYLSTINSGKDIIITADHLNLEAGSDKLIALGNLQIISNSVSQKYRIGSL